MSALDFSPPGTIHDDDDSAELFTLLPARPFIEPDGWFAEVASPMVPAQAGAVVVAEPPATGDGSAIMRDIIATVLREGWPSGGIYEFAKLAYGLIEDDGEYHNPVGAEGCGETNHRGERFGGWNCASYHHAPDPNSGAFESWLADGKAYEDLARCPWYRATFAWEVARSREWRDRLRKRDGIAYELDDTGAIVAPDDFRPEEALAIGGTFDGARILQFVTSRAPRTYMDDPPWWPRITGDPTRPSKKAAAANSAAKKRVVQRIQWGPSITAFVEYAPGEKPAHADGTYYPLGHPGALEVDTDE